MTVIFFSLILLTEHASAAVSAKQFDTGNGIRVLLLETHSLPMVQIELLVRAGSALDPPGKEGVSSLAATLLEEGTSSRNALQIADEFDAIGSDFGAAPGFDYSTFSIKILKKDLDRGLALFSDIILHPRFPDEELQRKKTEMINHLKDELDDPDQTASKAFERAVFRNHPYGHAPEGEEKSLKTMAREDVERFYGSFYAPRGSILAIVGDVTESEARRLTEKAFGSWHNSAKALPEHPKPPKLSKIETVFVDKDLAQTSIMLGHPGISRNDPDYYTLQVMNYILGGGGFSSRMMINIRENKGLVYGLFSHFDARREAGSFSVSLQTKNGSANEAIKEVLQEIRKIRTEPVAPEELQEAKDYLTGSFPLRMDTHAKLANFLINQEFYGLGLDYIDKYTEWIRKVTPQDILRAAKKHLDPDRFILVAVGKQSEARIQMTGP